MKHEAGWTVEVRDDGTTVWISPTGIRRAIAPATYPADITALFRPPLVDIDYRWHHKAA